jgi:hypothetical protein
MVCRTRTDCPDNTSQKAGSHRLIFADTDHQGVVVFTPIFENGNPAMLAARLKVRQHQIVELETMVTRKRSGFFNPEGLAVERPIWSKPAREKQRLSRSELVRAADSYFNGIVEARGDITPFDPDCWRYENSVAAVRNPDIENQYDIRRMGCNDGDISVKLLKIRIKITLLPGLVSAWQRQVNALEVTLRNGAVQQLEPGHARG